jgi:ubiquinone/menaquinone biosynthesis C-methylase UbiE
MKGKVKQIIKRAIGGFYSLVASKLYEPLIVKRAFPFFGGDLNSLAKEQGSAAVARAAGEPVLDVPVGTAFFTTDVAEKHTGLVVGTDYAWGMVEETRRAADAKGLRNLAALQSDIHNLPFRSGAFAVTLCTNGLQVIPGLDPSTSEIARTLKPGGTAYVSVISLPLSLVLPQSTREHLPTFLRSGEEVAASLERAGLTIEEVRRSRLATLIEARKPASN